MQYTNYKGDKKPLTELEHQHLSNIYWFNTIVWKRTQESLSLILEQIDKRFNGEILPYIPEWQFKNEIEWLESRGHFAWDEDKTEADVVYQGKVVGHYITPQKLRDSKLNQIID